MTIEYIIGISASLLASGLMKFLKERILKKEDSDNKEIINLQSQLNKLETVKTDLNELVAFINQQQELIKEKENVKKELEAKESELTQKGQELKAKNEKAFKTLENRETEIDAIIERQQKVQERKNRKAQIFGYAMSFFLGIASSIAATFFYSNYISSDKPFTHEKTLEYKDGLVDIERQNSLTNTSTVRLIFMDKNSPTSILKEFSLSKNSEIDYFYLADSITQFKIGKNRMIFNPNNFTLFENEALTNNNEAMSNYLKKENIIETLQKDKLKIIDFNTKNVYEIKLNVDTLELDDIQINTELKEITIKDTNQKYKYGM